MDLYFFSLINQFAGRWPVLDGLAIFFAKYFEYFVILAVVIIFCLPSVALAKEGKKWKIIFQSFLAAVLARFGIVELIRFLLPRARPFVENSVNLLLQRDATNSFPSGHAAFYFALATVVYFYNKKVGILFLIAAFLISISRVFAGVHWPSDILAGALVGIFSGWLVVRVFRKP